MVLHMSFGVNHYFDRKPFAICSSILLLIVAVHLFNPAAVLSQSSVIAAPSNTAWTTTVTSNVVSNAVPNSITSAQAATEAMLSRSVAAISIRYDEQLSASNVFELLGSTVFIDQNLDGVLDAESDMRMKAGVSTYASLKFALRSNDSSFIVESDGSILIICIDDEMEPDYLRNVTYDVTGIAGSRDHAESLAMGIQNTIHSDSWEQNGGGNATISIYSHNGRTLMTIRQSYIFHLSIRSHFESVARLAGSSVISSPTAQTRALNLPVQSTPSGVVAMPLEQTTSSLRSRRGFARPNSGTSGGMGGGTQGGGVF